MNNDVFWFEENFIGFEDGITMKSRLALAEKNEDGISKHDITEIE